MSSKEIVGLLSLRDKDGNVVHQGGNVSFLYQARYRTIYQWNNNYGGSFAAVVAFPWKMAYLLQDDDINIGHDSFVRAAGASYPDSPTGSVTNMSTTQYNFFRNSGTVGTVGTANIPRVFGGVGAASQYPGTIQGKYGAGDQIISQVDVPLDYTQIGIVYMHPAHQQANTVATTAGLGYVTYTNGQFWDGIYIEPGCLSIVRIESGSDAGYYFIANNNFENNRIWLRCLDGSPFKANATASGLLMTAGPGRRAWFNEVSVIPLSVGSVETSGRYQPRNAAAPYYGDPALRESWIMRLTTEKTGSTEAASGTEQQGSYLLSLRPFTHGDGSLAGSISDQRSLGDDYLYGLNGNEATPAWFTNFGGGVNGMVLDWDNQRLWFGMTNTSNQSSIYHWRYKTSEGFREIANYLGTAGSATFTNPTITLGAGDVINDLEMGSNTGSAKNWVYVTIYHASGGNGGVAIIKPDLTTLQYTTGSGVPAAVVAGCTLDRTRTRTGTAGDVSTDGSNNVTTATGGFTNADIGRAIKLTGLGADSGTYKIDTIGGATTVGVKTLAGGTVTFTSQSGGTYEIGDRLYLFFNDGTTGAGKINYMEAMAPGTFLTRTVTMTNGATINTRVTGGTGHVYGQRELCSIDRANGDVYWLSNDTQQQVNKYEVATNTHTFIPISNTNLLSPVGAVVNNAASPSTNPATPTAFTAIHVNTKFDDIWVGSDAGHFRFAKSLPLLSNGTGDTIGGTAPNMTLTDAGGNFTPAHVGRRIVILGATTAANNGIWVITGYTSSTVITYTNANGVAEAFAGTWQIENIKRYYGTDTGTYWQGDVILTGNGSGSSGLSLSGSNMTLNATGTFFNATHIGKYVIITGSSTNGNNGVTAGNVPTTAAQAFRITAVNSATQLVFDLVTGGASQSGYTGQFYIVSNYRHHTDGCYGLSGGQSRYVRAYYEGADGRMYSYQRANAAQNGCGTQFSQEADNWFYSGDRNAQNGNELIWQFYDPWGRIFYIHPSAASGSARWLLATYEVEYQWDNANTKWFPKEWVRTSMPNKSVSDTTSPFALARPIHSTYQDVMFGVKVRWNRQGGATPPNNEFLGRGGQTRTTTADGSTTLAGNTFGGSSFVSGDTGKLLRIETGADAGVYKVTYISAASVTLTHMDGSTVSFAATASSLTYTVWDLGTPGANAGPENLTVMLADGFGKDNTQDISGMTYEMFGFKTRFSENFEGVKYTVENPLAVPGSTATKVYYETYARATPQYDAALSHHRALPGAETTNGRQLCDFIQDKYLNNTGGRADFYSSPANSTIFYGVVANTGVLGASPMVDLGKDVEVGFIQIRLKALVASGWSHLLYSTGVDDGLIANLYSALDAGGTPVASLISNGTGDTIGGSAPAMTLTDAGASFTASDVGRYITFTGATTGANNGTFVIASFTSATVIGFTNASGVAEAFTGLWFITDEQPRTGASTNLNVSGANVTTVTVSSGNFLGAVTTGPFSNGAITASGNTLVAPAATFVQSDRMKILNITAGAGADNGAYRIILVSGDGSTVTVRNLDQTDKAWGSTASGLTYEVRDGVREEDQILTTTGTQHRMAVERLLTSTSLQARTAANATITNQSWICIKPSWTPVKRLSYSTEAVPPDVKNNGTWLSSNGRNNYDLNDVLVYFDLTDLPTAQRTGRYWKWTAIPRFAGNASGQDAAFYFSCFEFYDPSGNKLATSKYTSTDQTQSNADFYFSYLNRVDFIQSGDYAMSGVSGFNGTVDLGGANGDTLTLNTGGNKFLGFQVKRPFTDGNTTSPNALNSATAVWTTADVGRFVRFTTGTYAGNYYRIATRVSGTQVTLVTPSGGSPGLATDAGPMNFTVHSGISVGGTFPDKFAIRRLGATGDVTTTVSTNQLNSATGAFTLADIGKTIKVTGASNDNGAYIIKTVPSTTQVTVTTPQGAAVSFVGGTGGTFEVDSDLREYNIATINDSLTTITISETFQTATTNRKWEIRRPGYDTSSTTTEPTKLARITRPQSTYPVQSGDICQDSRGHYRFFSEDIGNGYSRADGSITGGSGAFTGTNFCSDDVGRLLYIDSGTSTQANNGIYEISVFTSATAITVKNHYTGAAVSFTADAGPVTYRVLGDRRFRLAKYCTGLRA